MSNSKSPFQLLKALLPACIALALHLHKTVLTSRGRPSVSRILRANYLVKLHCDLLTLKSEYIDSPYTASIPNDVVHTILSILERCVRSPALNRPSILEHEEYKGLYSVLCLLDSRTREEPDLTKLGEILRLDSRHLSDQNAIITTLIKVLRQLERWKMELSGTTLDSNSQFDSSELPSNPTNPELATMLYQSICKHWGCECDPPESHSTLHLRLATYRGQHSLPSKGPGFEMLFSTRDATHPWREAEVWIAHKPRRIKFAHDHSPTEVQQAKTRRHAVEWICPDVRDPLDINSKLRLHVDGDKVWRFAPARPKVKGMHKMSFLSLGSLLQTQQYRNRMHYLKEKYTISFRLANSLLYLYNGPWLGDEWTRERVAFLHDPQTDLPDIRWMYLTSKCGNMETAQDPPSKYRVHPFPLIFSLGVLLVELALGTTLDSRRHCSGKVNDDLYVADNMLEELEQDHENKIAAFVDVVRACIGPDPIFEELDSQEETSRKIYLKIVRPLEVILTSYGISLEDVEGLPTQGDEESSEMLVQTALDTIQSQRPSCEARQKPDAADYAPSPLPLPVHGFSDKSEILLPITTHIGEMSFHQTGELYHLYENGNNESVSHNDISSARAWMQALEQGVHPLIVQSPVSNKQSRIAILDTGIELSEELMWAYEDRLVYRSWIKDRLGMEDADGHGTHAAGLLLKIAPHAIVCVARVVEHSKDNIDPKVVAEAIRYAVDEWKVDFITMSLGFRHRHGVIKDALVHAERNNTVVFAAASNDGNRYGIAWPANEDQVICIHACDGNGSRCSFTPPSDGDDFSVLGCAIKSYWPSHLNKGTEVLRSGTSSASPIAAAIAAVCLEYIEARVLQHPKRTEHMSDRHITDMLYSKPGIQKMFKRMVVRKDGYQSLVPWKWLNQSRSELIITDVLEDFGLLL